MRKTIKAMYTVPVEEHYESGTSLAQLVKGWHEHRLTTSVNQAHHCISGHCTK